MNAAVAVRPDLGGSNFECPEGIKFVEVDSASGLLSTLTCPLRELIAVTERTTPHMECYLHGNLPVQSSPFAEEVETSETTVAVNRKRGNDDRVVFKELKTYRTTRVDVDSQGRRALVNDLR